jgi:hypothetical protein
MTPELILVINADQDHVEILKFEIDHASAVRLVNAARSTKGLMLAGEVTGILAAAIRQIEVMKRVEVPTVALDEVPVEIIEDIAHGCHEANRAYCASIGDHSHLPWDDTTQEIRNSAINGVKYTLEHLDVTPEELHDNWVVDKVMAGYVLGPVKNIDPTKGPLTHPNLRPYDELPAKERFKDELFRFTIKKAIGRIAEGTAPPIPPKE